METKFSIFPHFLGNQTESQQVEPQKNENFLHNFQSTRFHCKKKNENFIFFNFPIVSWQPNKITTSRTTKKKNENFLHNFQSTLFHCKEKNEIFIFFQLSHTFSVTKHNHTTKNNHKTYRKNQRQWSLKSPLQFLPTGVEVRISPP